MGDSSSAKAQVLAAALTHRVVAAAVGLGASQSAILSAAGIDALPPIDGPIPDRDHLALWAAAMRACASPALPIRYAEAVHVDDYGLLGLACKTAATLGEALHRTARYVSVVAEAVHMRVLDARVVVERDGEPGLGHRVAVESVVAELTTAIRQIATAPDVVRAVTFAHRAPSDVSSHAAFFRCPVRFGQPEHALELDLRAMRAPLQRSDRGLSEYLLGQLEARAPAPGWGGRTADEVERRLPTGAPEVAIVARALGVSARTLQRNLRGEGTRFQDVVTRVRRRLALELLERSDHSASEIAFLLGFSEPSAFHRAFKRWTGKTPRDVREAR